MTTAKAEPPSFSSLVVIGDSLSDSGNAGRFSDGPVWVEHVADRLAVTLRPSRLGGTNLAVGGARVTGTPTDLRGQADAFLAARGGRLDPAALYVVWGGANDLLGSGPGSSEAVATAAADRLARIVDGLAAAGAARILVPNLPDVGHTPALRAAGPAVAAGARRLSQAFDSALERALAQVESRRRIRILRLDLFTLADRVMADPATFGFRDTTHPCAGTGSCDGYLFWDQIHPTAFAHARLAAVALEVLGFDVARPSATAD
jgi:phospholipase/lecithinase/hemolysin